MSLGRAAVDLLNRDLTGPRRLSARDGAALLRELGALLGAGLTLDRALGLLGRIGSAPAAALAREAQQAVRGGARLSEALAARADAFSPFVVALVRAGEAGGELAAALERTAAYLGRARDLRESLRTALTYPAIVAVFAVLCLTFLIAVVIPQFDAVYRQAGAELPLATRIVLGLGALTRDWGWALLLLALAAALGARAAWRDPAARLAIDRRLLRFGLLRKLDCERFAAAAAALLSAGVGLPTALELAAAAMRNHALQAAALQAARAVREGETIGRALGRSGLFGGLLPELAEVGEEAGRLPAMLTEAAEIEAKEAETQVKRLLAAAGPVITIALGLIVGAIIVSMLAAMLDVHRLAF
jgi:general secretion pathway protein F